MYKWSPYHIISRNFVCLALTRFEALCGFRPASEILNYFHEVQEFLAVVGQEAVDGLINAEMATGKLLTKY